MKGRSFRDKEVGTRLRKASAAWENSTLNNHFEKNPRKHFLSLLLSGLLIVGLHLMVLSSGKDLRPTLSFLLPLAAGITFSSLFARYAGVRYGERSVLLPLSSAQVHKEIRREWRNGMIFTLLWVAFIGCFLNQGAALWIGAIKCLLIFLSMTAFMALCLLPSMAWLSSAVALIFGGFLALSYIGPFGEIFTEKIAPCLPWYLALTNTTSSWAMLGGIFLAGLAAIEATKRHWLNRPDFDCTYYYENLGGFSLEDLQSVGLDDEAIEEILPPPSATPKGALESFIWRFLSTRERVLARAAGLCSETFFSRWLILTVSLLVASHLWQHYTDWGLFLLNLTMLISLILLYLSNGLKSANYFTSTEISPNCAAASFAVLPIGFKTVEKLFYKEGLPKWACLSLTFALVSGSQSHESFALLTLKVGILFALTFVSLALVISIFFWSSGTNHWLSNKKRWRYFIGASFCFLVIFLIILSQVTIFFGELWEFSSLIEIRTTAISLAISLVLFLIARALMICRLNDPRCDLLKQSNR